MQGIDNILVIVDPTANRHPAIDKAARLAEKFSARIELFACETKQSRALRYAAHLAKGEPADFIGHVHAVLEALATPLVKRNLDVCVETAVGDPLHMQLLERVRHTSADLVIKDTHHHSLAKRTFVTNTDWHLIRGCPVPLLLAKERAWAPAPTIAAAVDPGHVNDKPVTLDERILEWAQRLHGTLGGSLHALHAFLPLILVAEASTGVPAMMGSLTPELIEEERQKNLARLRSLTTRYGIDARNLHAHVGVATDAIPACAEQLNADLVVMGAISRSGMQRIFIGSTAERVLETLPCDVLVVKPADFSDALAAFAL
jgi:universal stress protein E